MASAEPSARRRPSIESLVVMAQLRLYKEHLAEEMEEAGKILGRNVLNVSKTENNLLILRRKYEAYDLRWERMMCSPVFDTFDTFNCMQRNLENIQEEIKEETELLWTLRRRVPKLERNVKHILSRLDMTEDVIHAESNADFFTDDLEDTNEIRRNFFQIFDVSWDEASANKENKRAVFCGLLETVLIKAIIYASD